MKAVLKTVPPAPLPLGLWHPENLPPMDMNALPVPAVPVPANVNTPAAPLPLGRGAPSDAPGARDLQTAPSIRRGPVKTDGLLPPEDVPGSAPGPTPAPRQQKNFLQQLFGN